MVMGKSLYANQVQIEISRQELGVDKTSRDSQITGNIGLYYCCYKLSLFDLNVMPTSRNARGIDIIAYSRGTHNFVGIQVKTLIKRSPVPLGTSLDKIMGDFWVIINNVTKTPSAFILTPEEVKLGVHTGKKDGRTSYWLQPNEYDKDEFRETWTRITEATV